MLRLPSGLVFSVAFRRIGNRPVAEEVAQSVFVILAAKAEKLKGIPHLKVCAWPDCPTTRSRKRVRASTTASYQALDIDRDNQLDFVLSGAGAETESALASSELELDVAMMRRAEGAIDSEIVLPGTQEALLSFERARERRDHILEDVRTAEDDNFFRYDLDVGK